MQRPVLPTSGPDAAGIRPTMEEAHRRVSTSHKGEVGAYLLKHLTDLTKGYYPLTLRKYQMPLLHTV